MLNYQFLIRHLALLIDNYVTTKKYKNYADIK